MSSYNTAQSINSKYQDDLTLADEAASSSRSARMEIAERLFERIRTTIVYLAGTDKDFDDLVQISLLEVLKSVGTYKGKSSLETWADRITVRTSLRYLKRRRNKEHVVSPGVEKEGHVWSTGEQGAVGGQLRVKINQLLLKLSEDRRAVVILRFLYRHSIKEISEILETPVNTVRDRLKIGKRQLLDIMKKDPDMRDWIGESI
jgi:RNA polymerase sigma-70 factor, ECF subfamily